MEKSSNLQVPSAAELNAKAAGKLQEAGKAGNASGKYLAETVLFATVLFFASTSSKFERRRVRVAIFAFAVAIFVFALARMAILPPGLTMG
jgi:hypothetical protein